MFSNFKSVLDKRDKLLTLAQQFARIGIQNDLSIELTKRLTMMNYVLLVSYCNVTVFILIFVLARMWIMLGLLFVLFAQFSLSVYLMHRRSYLIPRLIFIPVQAAVIVMCDYELVGSSGARLFLFPVSFLGFLYFSREDYKYAIGGALCCLLSLIGIHVLEMNGIDGVYHLPPGAGAWLDLVVAVCSFLCTLAVVTIFYIQNIIAELKLKKEREKLSFIFDSVEEGLLMTDNLGRIQPEYSRYTEEILESDAAHIRDQQLIDMVFDKAILDADIKDQCRAALTSAYGGDEIQWIGNQVCFPSEFSIQGRRGIRHLHAKWQPLYTNEVISGILLSLQDVTEEKIQKEIQKRSEESQEMLLELVQGIFQSSTRKVEAFVQDGLHLLQTDAIKSRTDFRLGLHTLKGASRTLHLNRISNAVHQLEDAVAQGSDDLNLLSASRDAVVALTQRFQEMRELLHRIIGGQHLGGDMQADSFMAMIAELIPMARRHCAKAELDFNSIEVRDRILLWKGGQLKVLKTALMHAITNSIDHGYLFPWKEGRAQRKPVSLQVHCRHDVNGRIEILYRDGGAGISEEQLNRLLKKAGEKSLSLRNRFDVLFLEGVSTAENVTETSGRGVGMPAIRQTLTAAGGGIEVSSSIEHGLELLMRLPKTQDDQLPVAPKLSA